MVKGSYRVLVVAFIAVYAFWVQSSAYFDAVTKFSSALVVDKERVAQLTDNDTTTGIIFGGSNAVYSLSAQRLTELSGERWFNAAIVHDGVTFANGTKFLDTVASEIDPAAVTTVIYSTIDHLRSDTGGTIDRLGFFTQTGLGYDGVKPGPAWLPQVSLAKQFIGSSTMMTNILDGYGDLVFDSGDYCWTYNPDRKVGGRFLKWTTDQHLDDLMNNWLPYLHRTFPNATIIVTVPAQYYSSAPDDAPRVAYLARLTASISRTIASHPELANATVRGIMEAPMLDSTKVCNAPHHFNASGRETRTDLLWSLIEH